MALPAMLSLRKKYPDKKFTLVTSAEVKPFAELMGIFDEIVLIDTNSFFGFVISSLNSIAKVWQADGLINFEIHSKFATVFSCLSCARNRFGFYHEMNSWQRDVITHLFFYNITSPVYINYNQVALVMRAEILPYEDVVNHFRKHNDISENSPADAIAVLAPFCSDLGKERELTPEHWCRLLANHSLSSFKIILLMGGKNDINKANLFEEVLKTHFPNIPLINNIGKTSLAESVKMLSRCTAVFTIDSGLNHIARLIGGNLEICSYWGPTDPTTRLAPFPNIIEKVMYRKMFCSPCVHVVNTPPCKGNNICMKQFVEDGINQYSTGGWLIISDSAIPKNI